MELKQIARCLRFCAVAGFALFGLAASEHHGVVKFGSIPVPGATVTATQGDKKVLAVTDENGAYSFPDLPDGIWNLQVDMLTFVPATKEIGIAPNGPGAMWDLKLKSMDEINPAKMAPPPTAMPSATGTPAATPGTPAPAATPAPAPTAAAAPAKPAKGKNGKNAAPATPQAGFQRTDVNASADGAAASAAAPSTPSIAGAEASPNASEAFVVNGSSTNGIERRAIGNMRKGPGSLFNGGANFMFDNSVLNARNYSLAGVDTPKTPYNHFQLGLNFGGPLWVPHVFRWTGNFFITYQTIRNRTANNATATMPTDAQRNGDFSQMTSTVVDPSTGKPFPNNVIPSTMISDQAKYLLRFYPQPQFAASGLNYNYQASLIGRSSTDQGQARITKTINNKNFLNVVFAYQNSRNTNPNIFAFIDTNNSVGYQFTANLRHTFSRSVTGTFNAQFSRQSIRATPFFANVLDVSKEAGITGNDHTPNDWGPPSLSFQGSGIQGLSDGNQSFNRNQTLGLSANISYFRRPHNFQMGGDVRAQNYNILGQNNGRGQFGFDGTAAGLDFAGFLLGIPDSSSLAYGNADKYLRSNTYDAFINDDWRVSPALTLNYGVRWDYGSPIVEKYGRLVNLDIAPGFASSAPVVAQTPVGPLSGMHYPDSLMKPDKHEIQPRISFAWKPIFGASTLVRGAYGVYYNTSAYVSIANRMVQQSPLSKSLSVHNGPSNPLTLANGFIAAPSNIATTNTFGVDPDYRVGYSQTWTASVQQNVTASMVMTAAYVGIKGTRAAQQFLPNTYPIGAVNPCPTCLPGYSYLTSNGNSTKHSGQLSLRRRFHSGVATNFQYSYSKAIDDAGGLGTSLGQIAQDWRNLAGERGLSSFDQRHLLTATFQYSTGSGIRGGALLSGWRGAIIKGWTILSDITLGSGFPLSPVYSVTNPAVGINGTNRPQYVGGDVYSATGNRFLNAAVYAAPPAEQWGNAGRDTITGPNQFSMNASMQRSFKDNIVIRFDSKNVLNHANFPGWNTSFDPRLPQGGAFGLPLQPNGMRTVQATLRWSF